MRDAQTNQVAYLQGRKLGARAAQVCMLVVQASDFPVCDEAAMTGGPL